MRLLSILVVVVLCLQLQSAATATTAATAASTVSDQHVMLEMTHQIHRLLRELESLKMDAAKSRDRLTTDKEVTGLVLRYTKAFHTIIDVTLEFSRTCERQDGGRGGCSKRDLVVRIVEHSVAEDGYILDCANRGDYVVGYDLTDFEMDSSHDRLLPYRSCRCISTTSVAYNEIDKSNCNDAFNLLVQLV